MLFCDGLANPPWDARAGRRHAIIARRHDPRAVTLSKAGDALWMLSIPWFFGTMVIAYTAMWAGYLEVGALRVLAVVVAVAPLVMFFGSPVIGRLAGWRWLLATPQPLATLDDDGLQLDLADVGTRHFGWQEIDHMELHETWRRRWGELRGLDGSVLAIVPMDLVYLKETWRTAPTLAEAVVRMRPDLFVLTGAHFGRPDVFGRPGPAVPIDAAAVARAHARRVWVVMAPLSVVAVVLLLVLLLRAA